jgi:hypothetical protein
MPAEPIYSDRLADTCPECSDALYRPRPDRRLKENFVFCSTGHIWLNWYEQKPPSSRNPKDDARDKPGGKWADMDKKVMNGANANER